MNIPMPTYEIEYDTKAGPDKVKYENLTLHRGIGPWTLYDNGKTIQKALAIASTDYQKQIVRGEANMAGNNTRECKNSCFRDEYKKAYQIFLGKLKENGIECMEKRGKRRARILILLKGNR